MTTAEDRSLPAVAVLGAGSMGGAILQGLVASGLPTGGITAELLEKYLAFPKVVACGGSWMVTKELLAAKQFDKITEITRDAVQRAERARPSR